MSQEKQRRKPKTRRPDPRPLWKDPRMLAANDDTYDDEEPAAPPKRRPRARKTA